jgi:hypothetical protein
MVYMMKRNETNAAKIEIGDLIRAYDFEPCPGRSDCYVVGVIREIGWIGNEYIGYTIDCVYDTMAKAAGVDEAKCSRVGRTVYVPVQTSMDYDGRVTRI